MSSGKNLDFHDAAVKKIDMKHWFSHGSRFVIHNGDSAAFLDYDNRLRVKLLKKMGGNRSSESENLNIPRSVPRSPVIKAVIERDHQKLNDLLASGQDPNVVDEYGRSALFYAALNGYAKAVGILLSYGANVNLCDTEGKRAFEVACIKGHFDVARMLIEAGAVVDWPDQEGNCLSHIAAEKGRADILGFLALNGADFNRTNNDGDTPMHIAVVEDHPEAVEVLITSGASVFIENKRVKPLDLAVAYKRLKILDIMIRYCGFDPVEINYIKREFGQSFVKRASDEFKKYYDVVFGKAATQRTLDKG